MVVQRNTAYWVVAAIMAASASLHGQSTNTVPVPGANSVITLFPPNSGGSGAVDYSVAADDPSIAVSAAVLNVRVDALSQGTSSGGGGGSAGHRILGGTTTGTTSASASAVPQGAAAQKQLRVRQNLSGSSLSSMSARQLHTTGNAAARTMGAALASWNSPFSQDSLNNNGKETASGGGGANPVYTTDFPDSTRNTAILNPPVNSDSPLAGFTPRITAEFPDLSTYQFLRISLNVGAGARSGGQEEDLYTRIERRLEGYKAAEMPGKDMNRSTPSPTFRSGSSLGTKTSAGKSLNGGLSF